METLLVERDAELEGLVTITLNRPDKLNAINVTMHQEMQQVCRDLQDDIDTRVVILTGAGRAFSSGADLKSRQEGPPKHDIDRRARVGQGNRTCSLLESLDQVTIGAINGLAIGGGVVFATCLDIRLAAESAWFSIPEVDVELPLTWGALPRLMRELGPARTKELVMTCDRFTSVEAARWGFVNHVYPDDLVLHEARKLAAKLLAKDALSLAMTKSATAAMEQLMVPGASSYAEREEMLVAYQGRARRGGRS
ncbi:MAG: enoyl-CoA hydratase/isomerase family protein [Chloroflexi bacterium]|nr:enoyl-CoA hydratase/isomerase family protein [Chloroflexota bacterium]